MTITVSTTTKGLYSCVVSLTADEKLQLFTKLPGLVNEVAQKPYGPRYKIKTPLWKELQADEIDVTDAGGAESYIEIQPEHILAVLTMLYNARQGNTTTVDMPMCYDEDYDEATPFTLIKHIVGAIREYKPEKVQKQLVITVEL